MQTFVKSLVLHFEREVQEIMSDDYGYPKSIFVKRHYSVIVVSTFGNSWLYEEAMREYHSRFGKLVRVESRFNASIVKTNVHVKRDLPDFGDELVF